MEGESRKSAVAARTVSAAVLAAAGLLVAVPGQSQQSAVEQQAVLEEVVVTAQRREQSLQDVPVSIGTVSGDEIQLQGYRNLDALGDFMPSVEIDDSDTLNQSRKIRGFGTTGNALTLEQAVPIFVDGIHYGRPSQVKTAFLDVERIEVLKGPQPVYFGMNAIAGAFSILSREPTQQWEGYADVEMGNHGNAQLEGAFGGPLSDTLAVRVAGKYEQEDGFLEDVVTGDMLTEYENLGGRITVQWAPTDQFEATFKVEGSEIDKGPEAAHLCLTPGSLIYGRTDPTRPSDEGNGRSIWADPPKGEGWDTPHEPISYDCFGTNQGISAGGPYFEPPLYIAEENSDTGALDIRKAADYWSREFVGNDRGTEGFEEINSYTAYLDLNYLFENGIELNSKTAYNEYYRHYARDNSRTPFLFNIQNREEDMDQWSQEVRLSSAMENNIVWMVGLFWQKTDNDMFSNGYRGNVRRGVRYNQLYENQEWKSAFATVTFNFLDDKASIDVGGRYTDLDKTGGIRGWGAQWVYDVTPCAPTEDDDIGGGNFDPATCPVHPDAVQIGVADTTFVLDGADTGNLWTIPWRESRETPSSWRGPRADAVGLTALDPSVRNGPYDEDFSTTEFDPQVTLRYRINDNHSLFARWAQSFKAGGFDTGVNSINETVEDFRFERETAESFEVGAKGTYLAGRARYDVTVFETTFEELQIQVPTGLQDNQFINENAGEQRVRGIEFSTTVLVTPQLSVNFGGALMDGEFVYFPAGGCSVAERILFEQSGCDPDTGRIDRSGEETDDTPDWKFVLSADYWMPVLDSYQLTFNFNGYYSDDPDAGGFNDIVRWGSHGDLNLAVGFGPADDRWRVSAWGRNLLEPSPDYYPENDLLPDGFISETVSSSQYRTYGLKLRYNFF